MKALLLATLAITTSLTFALADESAMELANERDLGNESTTEESAAQLADQTGDAIPTGDTEESAQSLANQRGEAISPQDTEESASQLADETGGAISTTDSEESAGELAEDRLGPTPTDAASPAPTANTSPAISGVNGSIYAAVATPDGKVLIGGRFNSVDGTPIANLARLNADGSLDTTFLADAESGISGTAFTLALDPQGGLIVGGFFNEAHGSEVKNIARYLPDGTLDANFATAGGADGKIFAIAILPKGDIVIAGQFANFANQPRGNVATLSPTGALAATTDPSVDGIVRSLATLPNGGLLVGGKFETASGPRNVLRVGD
jgi:uncharacterized delta-60 repeat protein